MRLMLPSVIAKNLRQSLYIRLSQSQEHFLSVSWYKYCKILLTNTESDRHVGLDSPSSKEMTQQNLAREA